MLVLVAGEESLDLDDADAGYVFQNIDFGFPAVREVAIDRPGADGTTDDTVLVGARGVTIDLEVLEGPSSKQALVDRLSRFLHPGTRIDLYHASEVDGPVRRIRVRPEPSSIPRERSDFWPIQLAFKTVGSPFLTGVAINQVRFTPDSGVQVGRTYPRTYPRAYAGAATSAVIVHNAGNQAAHWVCRIDGPVLGPRIRNDTLGVELSFPSLSIAAGSYVEVSSENRTVIADAVSSRYSHLDFLHSTWWLLAPGDNAISMPTDSSDVPAQGQLSFFDTYLN